MRWSTEIGDFSSILSSNQLEYLMESSSTSSWKSTKSLKLSSGLGIGRETLITSSIRELVEFYWTNRKRFQEVAYESHPKQLKIRLNKVLT